jgi:hypothetical protein
VLADSSNAHGGDRLGELCAAERVSPGMEQAGAVMEMQHQPGPWIPRRATSAAAAWSLVADQTAHRRRQGAQIEVGKLRAVGRAISTGEAAELRKAEVDDAEERWEVEVEWGERSF